MSKKDQPYSSQLKGVAALLGESFNQTESTANSANTVAINLIKLPPSQPRRYFDPQKLEELSRSIKELGILEPLLVRPLPGGDYELVAGERRYRAASMAALTEVPIISREMDDATTYQVRLVENLQREDLNPLEETEGILELLVLRLEMVLHEVISHLNRMRNVCDRYDENSEVRHNVMSQPQTKIIEELFASLGRMSWQSFVKNRLPLLNLPQNVLEVLRSGQIEYTKAKAIARVQDDKTRKELLEDAIAYNLSLSEIKRKIQEIEQQLKSESPSQTEPVSIKQRVDDTFQRFKKAKVWDDPKKKAKIEKVLAQLEALIKTE
ncbi:plasmid partitioning protein ParB [Nostoc linckia z18]|uniref:Plasmid partitioning protein ParB n=2 Tax=Nostoc linckia TaxID=92942 RepID=A0A9Q6ELB6_NOSLI|nr:ParB/RepB/Spo0J family partition protein [Nostoc linckia]PHK42243.1 plasmid partitioning protein ParB [Nostoc linckia z15]PHK45450.1 plasmid partitioning protein ParB [Nostoc linckia z16]PHJ59027.1 plasmid partitioning protein ParB [Nostoc linckia z1]PHJ61880.1 plasmid partitioning protein ParB [Nostoc linckia z3]PHJ67797.1 plasmid partitioning protein ParB [Nostoc linckia z2]